MGEGEVIYSHQQNRTCLTKRFDFLSREHEVTNNAILIIIKKGRILQGIILWHWLNTHHNSQFFSLPHKMQPSEGVDLTNIGGQEPQVIPNMKDTSFPHPAITKST